MSGYKAGACHYSEDVSHIVGEMHGPTTFGTQLVAVAAMYDEQANTTRVEWRSATDDDVATATRDEFGIWRVKP